MADVLCPVVVGRAHEFEVLDAALADAQAGQGRVVFLVGEAGIGKSRLAREMATAAANRGCQLLRGRAVPGAAEVAFRPLTEALGAAMGSGPFPHEDELTAWLPALAAVLPGFGQPAGGPADVTTPARGEAVVRLLRALVAPEGGLLVLEDLHWADLETIAIVDHLVDHLERAPVLCIVTVRAEQPSAALELAHAVAARRAAPVLELHRLNDAQVSAMVHACAQNSDASVVDRVRAAADGVPFLVEELLASPGVPTTFAESVRRRLDDLDDTDRVVLTAAAALGRQFDWRVLASATELTDASIAATLERAVAVQLVVVDGDGFRFRHALTRDAVLDTLLPPRRQAVAAAALRAVEDAHPDLEGDWRLVAAELAEQAGAPGRAAELLLRTGDDALARGALRSAVGALERARALGASDDAQHLVDRSLAEAYALAGRVDDAFAVGHRVLDQFARDGATADATDLHLRLARAAIVAARWRPAHEQLDRARPFVTASGDNALTARLAVLDAEFALLTDQPDSARERAVEALDAARLAGQPELLCETLLLQGRCDRLRSLDAARASFTEALQIADKIVSPVWRLRALHELGTVSLLDRADLHELIEARSLAEELGALSTMAVLELELGAGWSTIGDHAAMRQAGIAAVELGRPLGLELVAASGWLWQAIAAAMVGNRELASQMLIAVDATGANNDTLRALALLGVETLCAIAHDDRAGARVASGAGTDLVRTLAAALPAVYRGLWPILLAVDGDNDAPAAADEFAASDAMVGRACRGYASYARAILALRSGADADPFIADGDRDLAHAPYWHHLGRRFLAEAGLATGRGDPDRWLREAEDWFTAHDCALLATSCARLRQAGDGGLPAGWARLGVTAREGDVLRLVADGLPNKEIASALSISARTVEKHVESLFRKTGARSRTELAALSRPRPDVHGTPRR
jgi:DNA-binding CsgD family transcriptional regulator